MFVWMKYSRKIFFLQILFRFVRFGLYLNNGDPPSGASFKTMQCSYLRVLKQKYGRTDLDYENMFSLNAAISEMKGMLSFSF